MLMVIVRFVGKGLLQKGTNEEAVWLRKKWGMGSGIQVMVASGRHVDSCLFLVIGGKTDEMGFSCLSAASRKNYFEIRPPLLLFMKSLHFKGADVGINHEKKK